jgi:multicomponent Na+:H+ antiporter subunit B
MIRHVILRALTKLLIPMIMLFALYVQFHGDYGPGGGFQAGVIFGAGIILYALMFGLGNARRVFPPRILELFVAFGLLLYGSVGIVAILKGGNFLDYDVLAHEHIHGQHLGILLVELGVGITVAAVMATIFFLFAGRGSTDV